jgi:predicted PurR-regulated permease PerM
MSFPAPSEKQARILWVSVTALAVAVVLALLGLLAWGLGWLVHVLSPILWPLAIAGILAYLLDPLVNLFTKRRVPRGVAILLVFIICVGAVLAVMANVVPRLIYETKNLVDRVPDYSLQVQTNLSHFISDKPVLQEWKEKYWPWGGSGSSTNVSRPDEEGQMTTGTNEATAPIYGPIQPDGAPTKEVTQWALKSLGQVLPEVGNWLLERLKTVASWAGMIIGLALVPVFVFYFLLEKSSIEKTWTDYLPVQESKFKEEAVFVLKAINDYMIVFFRGQVVVAMCIGVMLTIGFLILGLNYAVLLGLLAGVLSIVPYLGAILTIVPSVVLAAIQFKDWWHPLLVIAVFALVQMMEGLVISPKIMGDRVGLHPMTIIIAVLVGTTLMGGILGGILAIPLTAALRVLMFRYVWKERQAPPTPDEMESAGSTRA